MFKALAVTVSLILIPVFAVAAPPPQAGAAATGRGSTWNLPYAEKQAALTLMGHAEAGAEIYEARCAACHLPTGGGNPDGSTPRLAGQYTTVLIKQLADIRAGLRENPTMYPVAMSLADAQAIADLAAYIETLCIPRGAGQYEAPDAAKQIAYGKALFAEKCTLCHLPSGDGIKEKFYPVLAGQHYGYLLRQLVDIRDGRRGNAHPGMVKVVAKLNDVQLVALAAYQASLATRVRGWTLHPRLCQPD